MKKHGFNWLLFFSIAGLFLVSGCTQKHALTYTPVIEKQPSKHIQICLNDIADNRNDKEHIGVIRNLYYFPIIKIEPIQRLSSWISYALATELENSGYVVSFSKDNSRYSITGEVRDFLIDSYLVSNVAIQINLSLLKNEELVFSKLYGLNKHSFTRKVPANLDDIDTKTTPTPELYLQSICKEFIKDVNDHLERLSDNQ